MALITVAGSACVAGASEGDRNPLHPGAKRFSDCWLKQHDDDLLDRLMNSADRICIAVQLVGIRISFLSSFLRVAHAADEEPLDPNGATQRSPFGPQKGGQR
jgi:hypothetical protein